MNTFWDIQYPTIDLSFPIGSFQRNTKLMLPDWPGRIASKIGRLWTVFALGRQYSWQPEAHTLNSDRLTASRVTLL